MPYQFSRLPTIMKVALGLITLWPVIYLLYVMVTTFLVFVEGVLPFDRYGLFHCLGFLLILGLLALYCMDVMRYEQMKQETKVLWLMLFLLGGGFFAFPVYWYLYVWRHVQ